MKEAGTLDLRNNETLLLKAFLVISVSALSFFGFGFGFS
jgi:hypothetical protein